MANIILVLGYTLTPKGEIPTILQNRLEDGIAEFKKQKYPIIIVSGGKPQDAPDWFPTQAAVMTQYLQEYAIPRQFIISDDQSDNTVQQLLKLRISQEKHSITERDSYTIIASDCGFDKRVKALCDVSFPEETHIRVVASRIPKEMRAEHQEREAKALAVVQKWAPYITRGNTAQLIELEKKFREGRLDIPDYPRQL